jgi:hypothetical protein
MGGMSASNRVLIGLVGAPGGMHSFRKKSSGVIPFLLAFFGPPHSLWYNIMAAMAVSSLLFAGSCF